MIETTLSVSYSLLFSLPKARYRSASRLRLHIKPRHSACTKSCPINGHETQHFVLRLDKPHLIYDTTCGHSTTFLNPFTFLLSLVKDSTIADPDSLIVALH
jgi:hypothetical protein